MESLRELIDTELDAVSGGIVALAAGSSTSADFGVAVASSAASGTSTATTAFSTSIFFATVTVGNPGAGVAIT